jgi:hypothetical protein
MENIPSQLDRDVKKFHYDIVRLTARKREYQEALMWLLDRTYLSLVTNMECSDFFEIFYPDVGILSERYGVRYVKENETDDLFYCRHRR